MKVIREHLSMDFHFLIHVSLYISLNCIKYIADYPGLIHFIYVDRNCDCMIAPSITLKKTHLNGTPSLKAKVIISF